MIIIYLWAKGPKGRCFLSIMKGLLIFPMPHMVEIGKYVIYLGKNVLIFAPREIVVVYIILTYLQRDTFSM